MREFSTKHPHRHPGLLEKGGQCFRPRARTSTLSPMTVRSNNRVAAEDAGIRLDVFLARLPEAGRRGRAKALVVGGQVSVQGEPARKAGQVLHAGQEIAFTVIPRAPVEDLADPGTEPPELTVLYEDAWIVAISKPAGMPTHPPE